VIALACALPAEKGVPLSRWSSAELAREAVSRGIVERISGVTVWRWLSEDAIRTWNYRSWIFPRDPQFRQKAAVRSRVRHARRNSSDGCRNSWPLLSRWCHLVAGNVVAPGWLGGCPAARLKVP
jgi:hypothetical protein